MTLEDSISREQAAAVIDSTPEELARWNAANHLRTVTLPVAVVGAGNSNVAGKYEGLLHSIVCEMGNEAASRMRSDQPSHMVVNAIISDRVFVN